MFNVFFLSAYPKFYPYNFLQGAETKTVYYKIQCYPGTITFIPDINIMR